MCRRYSSYIAELQEGGKPSFVPGGESYTVPKGIPMPPPARASAARPLKAANAPVGGKPRANLPVQPPPPSIHALLLLGAAGRVRTVPMLVDVLGRWLLANRVLSEDRR